MPEVNSPRRSAFFCDASAASCGDESSAKASAFARVAHHLQNLDGRIIVVDDIAVGRLTNQLRERRLDPFGLRLDDVPLRRGRQGNAHARLHPFRAVERHSHAVFQQGDHAACRRIILLRADSLRRLRRENLAAQVATQLLKFVNLGLNRRLADQPHQHARTSHFVNGAFVTLRTRIAGLQRRVTHLDLFRTRVSVGGIAAVPLARRFRSPVRKGRDRRRC